MWKPECRSRRSDLHEGRRPRPFIASGWGADVLDRAPRLPHSIPALLEKIGNRFRRGVKAFAVEHEIPILTLKSPTARGGVTESSTRSDHSTNANWMMTVAIAADLLQWFQLLCLGSAWVSARPKAMRWSTLYITGRLVTTGRRPDGRVIDGCRHCALCTVLGAYLTAHCHPHLYARSLQA